MEHLEDSFIPNLRPLFKAVISPFNNTLVIANKMRAKPYRKGFKSPKLPLKLSSLIGTDYHWNDKGYLVDKWNNVVPCNASKAGQPRVIVVNGQDLYNDKIQKHGRASYMEKLENYIRPYIEENEFITQGNLKTELRFYLIDKRKNKTRDNKMVDDDNLWIWEKAIRDVMKTLIVPDDDLDVFRGGERSVDFVETEEETRLEILIWKR